MIGLGCQARCEARAGARLRQGSWRGVFMPVDFSRREVLRPMSTSVDITTLLMAARERGDPAALDEIFPVVYEELRRLAHARRRARHSHSTLNTTALVHEAYLKLVRLERIHWQDRVHFFALSARLMRRILINHAERRNAAKRGGGQVVLRLEDVAPGLHDRMQRFAVLDEALERLEQLEPRQCRVVECRFFGGLSVEETAEALEISPATVKRDWTLARAWLNRELA
jgi:RNA polymerase sigma factor (TIGR02999 family)